MRVAMGLVMLFFGIGLVVVALQGWRKGVVPSGGSGLRRHEWTREQSPFMFTIFAAGYFIAGVALTIYSLMTLFGSAAPLPLR